MNTIARKIAVIAGATGSTGRHLLHLLLNSGIYAQVHVLHYRAIDTQHPLLSCHILPFDNLDTLQLGTPVHDVFCCLGTTQRNAGSKAAFLRVDRDYPIALARLAVRHHAGGFFCISAMGAGYRLPGLYMRAKYAMERGVQAVAQTTWQGKPQPATPLQLHFFRPALLVDAHRKEHRPGEVLGAKYMQQLTRATPRLMHHIRETEVAVLAHALYAIAQQQADPPSTAEQHIHTYTYGVADLHRLYQLRRTQSASDTTTAPLAPPVTGSSDGDSKRNH